jgi:hypothetical protein
VNCTCDIWVRACPTAASAASTPTAPIRRDTASAAPLTSALSAFLAELTASLARCGCVPARLPRDSVRSAGSVITAA